MSLSVVLAGPKGNGIVNANPHSALHGNPHGGSALAPAQGRVNPAGIITGSGGVRATGTVANYGNIFAPGANLGGKMGNNAATVTNPNPFTVMAVGDSVFLYQSGSNVVVKLNSQHPHIPPGTAKAKTAGGKKFILAAGDVFANAISNIDSLSASGTVPDPIGAKGPNPVHGGSHPKKGLGNPGGGNDNNKGHWGEGNKGNGVGNNWTGNQGRGVGEGMAGGTGGNGGNDENGGNDDNGNDKETIPAVPLVELIVWEVGGCPSLMEWLAEELEIQKDIQSYFLHPFSENHQAVINKTTIDHQAGIHLCGASAKLLDAAAILNDPEGTHIAALQRVINELVATPLPPSEEQMASIVQALSLYRDNDVEPYYAEAGQWLDALVEYIRILNTEIGWSAEKAVALVADKYVTPAIEGGDTNLIVFIKTQLEALSG